MACESRTLLKELRNGLANAKEKTEIVKWISLIRSLISSNEKLIQKNEKHFEAIGYGSESIARHRRTILQSSDVIQQLFRHLLSQFSVDWLCVISSDFGSVVTPVFLEGPVADAFSAIFKAVVPLERRDIVFHTYVSLLERMMDRSKLFELLRQQSQVTPSQTSQSPNVLSLDAEMLLTFLTSLPENMANRLREENSEKFLPQNYIPMLALAILDTLEWSHRTVTTGQDVSLLLVSYLVGKLCMVGYSDLLLDTLLPHLCAFVRADHIWCRICQRVFAHVPPRNLEAVVLPLLKKIPWYGLVDRFLGDCVLQNANIRSLISTKLLLHRHFQEPKLILHNIAGYLKSSRSRRPLFLEVFLSLLSVWGNKTSMQHISTEQHLYISQALLVFISALSDEEKTTHKDKALRLLMPGVTSHLENSDPQVRTVGMVVAKVLTQTIDPSGPQLDFELDKTNPMVTDLLSYQEIPDDPGPTAAEKAAATSWSKDTSNPDGELDKRMKSLSVKDTTQARMADLDLDSDDDLMPYDMSNDKKVSEAKHPKYVRECMEGLIYSTDDPDKLEVCLRHAEGVIRRKPDGLTEIAAEFAKILLHLQDTQSIENFATNRMLAIVALAVTCPEPVAAYLIAQFYDRNYSLRQRMDILEVLTTASQELSQPDKTEEAKEAESSIEDISASTESSSWQEIVRKRIESNTRRFCKGRTTPEPTPTMNRFAPVAGSFFYPLMSKVDTKEPSLDLLGRDSMLLNKLLLALATILQSALNLPSITQMGRTLLDFTWPLRLHSDQCIRQSVLLAVTTVFVVVPISLVMTDLLAEVTEAKCWIEDVIEKDPDSQCQHLARQALFILNEQMKLEMKGPTV